MEVHSHAHTDRKKWTHYVWEFIMLFLAVFCGFLAENQREHMVERHREKEFIVTMLEDLRSDLPMLDSAIQHWKEVNESIDSLTDAISLPADKTDWRKAYRHMNAALNYWSFKYNDRTVVQLKNSGNFRLIRNRSVANKIIAYDQFNMDALFNIALQHNKFYENATEVRSRLFAEKIISVLHDKYANLPSPPSANGMIDTLMKENQAPLTLEDQTKLLFEFKNRLIALKRDYDSNMNWGYSTARSFMNSLIALIRENYHLQ